MKNDSIYRISLIVLVFLLVLPLAFMRIVTVDSEHVGMKYDKRLGDITQCSGRVIYNSMTTEVYVYPVVKYVNYDSIQVMSADGLRLEVSPTLSYRIDSPVDFFKNRLCIFDYEKLQMRPESYEVFEQEGMRRRINLAYATVSSQYSLDSLMRYNREFAEEVNSAINSFKEDGISVDIIQMSITPPKGWVKIQESLKNAEEQVAKLQEEVERQTMIKKMMEGNI